MSDTVLSPGLALRGGRVWCGRRWHWRIGASRGVRLRAANRAAGGNPQVRLRGGFGGDGRGGWLVVSRDKPRD